MTEDDPVDGDRGGRTVGGPSNGAGGSDGGFPGPVVVGVVVILGGAVALFASLFVFSTTGCACSPPMPGPRVDFEYDYQAGNDSLVVTHDGGDRVPVGNVTVVVNGHARGRPSVPGPNRSDPGQLTAGETLVVANVSRGDTVELVWTEDDSLVRTLGGYGVPENATTGAVTANGSTTNGSTTNATARGS